MRDSENGEPAGLLTASELARRLGVSRSWVYQHARELGAITLGDGPRARLRFDLRKALAALAADDLPSDRPTQEPKSSVRRGRSRRAEHSTAPLLPIRPRGVRGVLAAWARGGFDGRW